jgi:hypothetical protein
MTTTLTPALTLLAQARPQPRASEVWLDPRTLLSVLLLVGTLLLAAGLIALLVRWRQRQFAPPPDRLDTLTSFHEAFKRGELTPEEYERIRNRLAGPKAPPAAGG